MGRLDFYRSRLTVLRKGKLMEILLGLVIGFVLGWIALKILIYIRVRDMLNSIATEPVAAEPKTIKLNFVREKNRIYAYDSSNDMFMAHGENKEEIIVSLNKRFPKIGFTANSNNLKEVGLE